MSVAILEVPQNESRCSPKLNSGWLKKKILLFVTLVWQHADFKCWVQGNAWHRPPVSLKRCKSSSASFGCCFPWETSQIVTAMQRGQSPWGEPKYRGNQASFSLWEPFSIPDILLVPLSSSPPILSASENYKHSVSSLWFHPKWSPSFRLQPAHLPEPRIDQFLIFFLCRIGQWCIAEYITDWFLQLIKMSRTDILWRLIPGRHRGPIGSGSFLMFPPHSSKTWTVAQLEAQIVPSYECVGVLQQQQSGLDDSISGPAWHRQPWFLEPERDPGRDQLPLCINSSIHCSGHHFRSSSTEHMFFCDWLSTVFFWESNSVIMELHQAVEHLWTSVPSLTEHVLQVFSLCHPLFRDLYAHTTQHFQRSLSSRSWWKLRNATITGALIYHIARVATTTVSKLVSDFNVL